MVITRRLCYLLVIPKWCAAQWQWGLLLQIANWLVLRCEYCRWKNRLLFVHFILWLFLWQSRKRSSCLFEWEIPNSSNWTIFLFCLPWIVALIAKGNFCECINYTFVCWLASDVQWLKSVLYGMVIKISWCWNLIFHSRREQIINSTLSSPSTSAPDPCAKETVLNALKERKKRTVEEEDQIFADGQENKRR